LKQSFMVLISLIIIYLSETFCPRGKWFITNNTFTCSYIKIISLNQEIFNYWMKLKHHTDWMKLFVVFIHTVFCFYRFNLFFLYCFVPFNRLIWEKGKVPRKHRKPRLGNSSLGFYSCASMDDTPLTLLALERNSIFKCKQHTTHDPRGPENTE